MNMIRWEMWFLGRQRGRCLSEISGAMKGRKEGLDEHMAFWRRSNGSILWNTRLILAGWNEEVQNH